MKHLLIILSFILLTSPLFGQKTGVLYQYETSSGIQWKTSGDSFFQPQYKGEISNGKPDGLGILYNGVYLKRFYFSPKVKFIGEWKNGEIHGQGTLTLSSGMKKIGEFRRGFPWNTTSYDKNRNILGMWVNGNYTEVTP